MKMSTLTNNERILRSSEPHLRYLAWRIYQHSYSTSNGDVCIYRYTVKDLYTQVMDELFGPTQKATLTGLIYDLNAVMERTFITVKRQAPNYEPSYILHFNPKRYSWPGDLGMVEGPRGYWNNLVTNDFATLGEIAKLIRRVGEDRFDRVLQLGKHRALSD